MGNRLTNVAGSRGRQTGEDIGLGVGRAVRQPALSPMACKLPVSGVDSKKVTELEPSFLNLTKRMSPGHWPQQLLKCQTEVRSGEEVALEPDLHVGKGVEKDFHRGLQRTCSHSPWDSQLWTPAPERTSHQPVN